MKSFPLEVLERVFLYVPKEALPECMEVCRLWYAVAFEKMYEDICYNDYAINGLEGLQLRIDNSKIKKLHFSGYINANERTFQQLTHLFPNFRVIEGINGAHLQFLNNSVIFGHLRNLEEILINDGHTCWGQQDINSFLAVDIQLKNLITSLKLNSLPMFEEHEVYETLLKTLSGLRNLNSLCISNSRHNIGPLNLTSILNACNSLVSLELDNLSNWEIDTENNLTHTNLSSLKIFVNNLEEKHMEYIIKHLPKLRRISLEAVVSSFQNALATSSRAIVKKFVLFLKKLKYLEIQGNTSPTTRGNVSQNSMEEVVLWDFVRDLSDEGCHCDLNVNGVLPGQRRLRTILTKQNKLVRLDREIPLDSSNYDSWVQQLDILPFKSIRIVHGRQNGFLNSTWMQTLTRLLMQQWHKQICSIYLYDGSKVFQFESKNPQEEQPLVTFGYISKVVLWNEILKDLGQLYPLVEVLRLDQCTIEKEDDQAETYKIDLSQFGKLQELVFDLDRMIPMINKIMLPLYIKLINVTKPESFNYYCYRVEEHELYYLGQKHEYAFEQRLFLLNIYHSGIKNINFRRFDDYVPIIAE